MDEDWQHAALTNRHLHNRVGKHGRGKGGKSNGAFDVQKALGTYEVKCHAAGKLVRESGSNTGIGRLEIYHLNEQGNALVGELFLPDVLHGTILMTGSRKTMKAVVRSYEQQEEDESECETEDRDSVAEEDEDHRSAEEEEDEREERRYKEFERNSFRSPKFWIKWQGQVLTELPVDSRSLQEESGDKPSLATTDSEATVTDKGYLVFAGNNCEKFQCTLSCRSLEWDNVKVQGWKLRSHTARDFEVHWVTQSH